MVLGTDGSVWKLLFGLAEIGCFVIIVLREVLIIITVLCKILSLSPFCMLFFIIFFKKEKKPNNQNIED